MKPSRYPPALISLLNHQPKQPGKLTLADLDAWRSAQQLQNCRTGAWSRLWESNHNGNDNRIAVGVAYGFDPPRLVGCGAFRPPP